MIRISTTVNCNEKRSADSEKEISGPEFQGSDKIEFADTTDWLTNGGVEAIKETLDSFEWNGDAVVTLQLSLSPDNRKVDSGKVFMLGELMRGQKDFRANRLFEGADKELRVSYSVEEGSTFTFNSGTLVGDYVDSQDPGLQWHAYKKGRRGETSTIDEEQHEENHINRWCIRPFLIPLSATKVKMVLAAYPMARDQLMTDHPECKKAAFPGLELTAFEIDLFPLVDKETGKSWGCPVIPLLYLGGSEDDHPTLPPTEDIKAKISAVMRTAIKPDMKRDLRTLLAVWQAIKESGPSKMKEKRPDLLWPQVETSPQVQLQQGRNCCRTVT